MTVHAANRREWHLGDLVLHDRDAKERRMVRLVIGFKDGLVRTRYAFRQLLPAGWCNRVMLDRPRTLLNPRRFHISVNRKQA